MLDVQSVEPADDNGVEIVSFEGQSFHLPFDTMAASVLLPKGKAVFFQQFPFWIVYIKVFIIFE